MDRLSIVIANYNYGRYLATAVESALALDWPDVEVIVVDDGSTDDSLKVAATFGDRITVIAQPNGGNRSACNVGFPVSTGDVVMFLDADDFLEPSIARKIDEVWRPGISKVQVQMKRVDETGASLGTVFPALHEVPQPEQIRRWMLETSAYPTPPGSGNAYSRDFLDKLFPLDNRCGEFSDSELLAAAPYLGDVVTIPEPLVGYRIHGSNDSALMANPSVRFTQQVNKAYQRHMFGLDYTGQAKTRDPLRPLFRGRHLLQMRIAERRYNRGPAPIPSDSRWRMFRNTFSAPFAPGPEPMSHRVRVLAWCLATLVTPDAAAKRLIAARFGPRQQAPTP